MNSPQVFDALNFAMAESRSTVPTRLLFRPGCRREAPGLVRELGRRPVVVTTRGAMQMTGFLDELLAGLRGVDLETAVIEGLDAGPTTKAVDVAAWTARQHRADCVVALGGGTVIDGAKALAAVVGTGTKCADLLSGRVPVTSALPLLVLPATAGTGSEMNRSAILTDRSGHRRDGLRSDHLYPRHALVDQEICATQPPAVAARTAFDALSHAIESFVSPRRQVGTDTLAEAAMSLIAGAIIPAARGQATSDQHGGLALSAAMMGVNLSLVGTCLPHRIDKAVSALFPEIAHGQCLAFFYPAWARRCAPGAAARFARIARILDPSSISEDDASDAARCSQFLTRLLDTIGLGKPPSAFGVRPDHIPQMIERLTGDLRANPVPFSPSDLKSFLTETIR